MRNTYKRILAMALCLVLCLALLPAPEAKAAASYTINGKTIPNSNCPADGSNPWCSCGMNVGSGSDHWCCWNYAAAVYQYLWGVQFSRYSGNLLRDLSASDRTLTAAHLKQYLEQTASGAVLRMDSDSVATNGDNNGHSLVFVQMNTAGDGAVFLEGNYNGLGNSRLVEWIFSSLASAYARYTYI